MDRKRDAPIPWSVSLPCIAAVVALAFGWRALGRRQDELASAKAAPPPSAAATKPAFERKPVVEVEHEPPPVVAPKPSPAPVASPVPAPNPAPTSNPVATPAVQDSAPSRVEPRDPPDIPVVAAAPSVKEPWTPLAQFHGNDLDDGAQRTAVPAVLRLRDRVGLPGDATFVRSEPSSRTLVIAVERCKSGRAEVLVRTLSGFGERLDALLLAPAQVARSVRPWVAVFVSDEAETIITVLASRFGGVVAANDDHITCRDVGEAQLRVALARGPEGAPLEWLLAGAVGAAASPSLAEAVSLRDESIPILCGESVAPLPSLSQLLGWRTPSREHEALERECLARLSASFVAFCLERGPKDPRAAGIFELLRLDGRSLPEEAAARDAEIAARLGATRLDELDAAWQAARR